MWVLTLFWLSWLTSNSSLDDYFAKRIIPETMVSIIGFGVPFAVH